MNKERYLESEFVKLHAAIEKLAQSTATSFEKLDHRLGSVEHQLGSLREEVKGLKVELRSLPEELEDGIEKTYGNMLNEHEDRIRSLEAA